MLPDEQPPLKVFPVMNYRPGSTMKNAKFECTATELLLWVVSQAKQSINPQKLVPFNWFDGEKAIVVPFSQ